MDFFSRSQDRTEDRRATGQDRIEQFLACVECYYKPRMLVGGRFTEFDVNFDKEIITDIELECTKTVKNFFFESRKKNFKSRKKSSNVIRFY